MNGALSRGISATVETERAPRLQPQGPWMITPPPPKDGNPGSTAECSAVQPKSTRGVVALDEPRPILNVGHAKKLIKGIGRLVKIKYNGGCCEGPEARDYFIAYAMLENIAAPGYHKYVRRLRKISNKIFPNLTVYEQDEILADINSDPNAIATDHLIGYPLHLTDEQRDKYKLFDAAAIDMDADARVEKVRASDRHRKAAKRREAGVLPRGEATAYERLLDPDASLRTLQRRAKARLEAQKARRGGPRKRTVGPPSTSRNMAR